MKKRVITAAVALAVLLPILWFSAYFPFVLLLAAFSVLAVFEVACCFGLKPDSPYLFLFYAAAAVLPFAVRYAPSADALKVVPALAGLLTLYGFSVVTLLQGRVRFSVAAGAMLFGFYLLAGVNAILFIRDSVAYNGRFLFMLVFLGAWVTDCGAQLVGMAFGRHKLIERVSPNKTVEGAVGGVVCGVLGYVVYALIVSGIYKININVWALLLLAVVITVADQLGDLIASAVKREFGIKDYGWIFPGHGGAVDRMDSIVSNALVIAAYVVLGLPTIF